MEMIQYRIATLLIPGGRIIFSFDLRGALLFLSFPLVDPLLTQVGLLLLHAQCVWASCDQLPIAASVISEIRDETNQMRLSLLWCRLICFV